MDKALVVSLVSYSFYVICVIISSTAAPPQFDTDVSTAIDQDGDPVVLVYLPRWQNRNSRRIYLMDILRKISKALNDSTGIDNDAAQQPSDISFSDRIDKHKKRPGISQEDDYTPSVERDSPLTFVKDKHNPDNILQKTSQRDFSFGSSKVRPSPFSSSDAIDTLGLTFELMKYSQWDSDNAVISPLGISNFLALLMLGADGKTFNELTKQTSRNDPIHFDDKDKEIKFHVAFQRLLHFLVSQLGNQVELEIGSTMYADVRFPLKESFKMDALHYYNANASSINFQTQGEEFKNRINEWVKKKTHGKISTMIENIPSPTTTFAFVNALYFKGQWEVPFPKQLTRRKEFHVSTRETVPVNMMLNQITIPYVENDQFQMIALPYKDNRTGFFVILPKEINGIEGLKKLEATLTREILSANINSMKPKNVAIKIPKLQIRSDGHMQEILTRMGLSSLFDPRRANFSKLSDTHGVFVSSVYHQACIDLDETGTEATAATAGIGDRTIEDIPIIFTANRPFSFFIYHIRADTMLFWGRITRPNISTGKHYNI